MLTTLLLYASPEYNALKIAAAMDIEARFIDLPYSEILITTAVNKRPSQ